MNEIWKEYFSVHRLVAKSFIPNPHNLPQVNHKNGIKHDNQIENLEWCDASHNQKHAVDLGLSKPNKGADCYNAKAVVMKTLNGIKLKAFPTIIEAANELRISRHSISKNLSGRNKTCHGYLFESLS
jgi:hypothetical protein